MIPEPEQVLDSLQANPQVLWGVAEELRRRTRENILRLAGPWEEGINSNGWATLLAEFSVEGEPPSDRWAIRDALTKTAWTRRCVGGRMVAAVFCRPSDQRWIYMVLPGEMALREAVGSTRGLAPTRERAQQEVDHQLTVIFGWEAL